MVSSVMPRRMRDRWRVVGRPQVLLTVVSLLCTLLVVSMHNATPAAAQNNEPKPLSQTAVVTNNIQGSTAGADSKWTTTVRGFIQTNDIVLLQEAGPSGPPGSTEQVPIVRNGNTIRHFQWEVGADHNGPDDVVLAQVYFLQTDDNGGTGTGGRVNTAIVTRALPDDFMVVVNPNAAGRTALGVRFGTNWYFSFHGLSGNRTTGAGVGADSGPMLAAIATAVTNYNAANNITSTYTVGGDFNREPVDLAIPAGSRILRGYEPTQQSGRELDYFVSNDPTSPASPARRLDGAQSDHYAVMMGALRAAAGPPSLRVMVQAQKCGIECDATADILKNFALTLMAPVLLLTGSLKRSVEFVGDDTSSGGTPEEGAAGEEISVDASQDTTAIPKYMPNVVMLQAGTQDLLNGDQASAPGQLSALIDQIHAADPTTVVMVATLDPMANTKDEALVTAYNTSVRQLVAAKVAAGRRVVLADMSDLTTADLNADGVTPNATGQQKIADAFTGALLSAEVMGWISEPNPASPPSGSVCDVYAYYGTACVGAYSMTRAMYSDYDGPLYQVQRASDGTTADIGLLSPGGNVNAGEQDSFCSGTTCTVTMLYDQSPQLNNLTVSPGGGAAPAADHGADATALPITVGGRKAYGLDVTPGTGYRDNDTRGVATGGEPEGMYMVASGTNVNSGCCFDFGNAETDTHDTGNGHMDAVNLSTTCFFQSTQGPCTGNGPWVEADLENGLFQGKNGTNTANTGNRSGFVTAMLKNNGGTTYALKGGDAQSGGLSTWWEGGLPNNAPGYIPMQKEGAIVLGTGGDNSNWDTGSFFEGVMTDGVPSDAADAAVQANIVSAGYAGNSGGATTPSSAAGPAVVHDGYSSVYSVDSANGHLQETYLPKLGGPWSTQDLSAEYGTPTVMPGTKPVTLTHDGYTSVYTVDASNGHLQETYLPKLGDPWTSQDLSAKYGTPQVQAGTSPVAIVHSGYTSVYTVDPNHHLQETYLPKMGDPWSTQDLAARYGTPPPSVTPTAVVHQGYTSVYTVDDSTNHLQETYLPAMGDPWNTQDLAAKYGTPAVAPGTQPVALHHTGYTSLYTVDQGSRHVQETYLPAIGQPWTTQDFTAKYGTPVTVDTPVVLVHPDTSGNLWTSVYTIDEFNDHLQETYLPAIGDNWTTQDISAKYGTPPTLVNPVAPEQWSAIHDGYTSVFTVDADNGHLQETYLDAMGKPWSTQDLSAKYGTPVVRPNTIPITVSHDGYTSVFTVDAADDHLQETYLSGIGANWVSQDLSAKYGTPPVATLSSPSAVQHQGYTSVYTDNAADGHLNETYLSGIGANWISQDLSAKYGTPPMAAQSSPSAVVHSGWTSVYTIDAAGNHLQETYLPAIGDDWTSQDLSAKYGTPPSGSFNSPSAVVHSGWTSVYTVDANHDLQETYLPAIGDDWTSQDLSAKYGTPGVASGTPPVALYHTGYTSVYTINDSDHHLNETYLPAIGDNWTSQDLSAKYGTPAANQAPSALVHYDADGGLTWTSVYTVNSADNHLNETYLSGIGAAWISQDLSAKYGTPPV